MVDVEVVGVRHHSPAAARLIAERIRRDPPSAVLVEGPADADQLLDQLLLDHRLPVMLYAWSPSPGHDAAHPADGARRVAYYPLCDYSPEWTALRAGRDVGAHVELVDLPILPRLATPDDDGADGNGYAEPDHHRPHDPAGADGPGATPPGRRGDDPVEELMRRLGVESLDAVCDELVEIDPTLDYNTFRARMALLGAIVRDERTDARTAAREAHMAGRALAVAATADTAGPPVLLVCGAAHVPGIEALLAAPPGGPGHASPDGPPRPGSGIAITPTSYAALDALDGYDAGQPSPGFYDELHRDRAAGRTGTAVRLLHLAVADLRAAGRSVSAADLVAATTTLTALASLRGHHEPWRTDLLDACLTTLVRDDRGTDHPVMARVRHRLRGDRVGRLHPDADRPPFTVELVATVSALDLDAPADGRTLRLDLADAHDRRRSQVLHCLALLGVPLAPDGPPAEPDPSGYETWWLRWSPEVEGALVTAARFGATRTDAVAARLAERSHGVGDDPALAAAVLLDAVRCGALDSRERLLPGLLAAVARTQRVDLVGQASTLLMGAYRYDALLGVTGDAALGAVLEALLDRGVRLVERIPLLGSPCTPVELVDALRALSDVAARCHDDLDLDVAGWDEALAGLVASDTTATELRGAALGARWLVPGADDAALVDGLRLVARHDDLGDLLAGVLAVAREAVVRRDALLLAVDERLAAMDDAAFWAALPGLRRAFARYTRREQADIAHAVGGSALAAAPGPSALDGAATETAALAAIATFLGPDVVPVPTTPRPIPHPAPHPTRDPR